MARYRFYLVDRLGHVRSASDHDCASDDVAVSFAQTVDRGAYNVEVWQQDRMVGLQRFDSHAQLI